MSRSEKSRYSTRGKLWKDTVLASRSQKSAWSKTKKRQTRTQRARDKASANREREA